MRANLANPSHLVANQTQSKKIFCAYHPTQFLTNFCLQKQCLMPLCPSCVVQHTQQHYQAKQKPSYVNINDAMNQVKQKCYAQISQLQEYHRINQQIMNYIEGLRLYIRKQLNICKQTVFDHINVLFEEYESSLYKQITQKYHQSQVYDFQQSKEVKVSILENIESLYDKTSLLKGDSCLSTLIKYYAEDEELIDQNIEIIKEYLQKNKNAGGIHIGLDQEGLVTLFKGLCQKVVLLKTITQKDLEEDANKNNKKKGRSQGNSNKPITISQRLRSPLDPNRKVDKKGTKYESPFKQRNYKFQKNEVRGGKIRPGYN